MRIIPSLIDAVFPPRETELLVRNIRTNAQALMPEPVVTGIEGLYSTSLFRYENHIVQACIQEAKFNANTDAAQVLGEALYEFLFEFLAEHPYFSNTLPILIPIPLSTERIRERGYNQTERIVRISTKDLSHAEVDSELLARIRNTKPQTSCTGVERQTNMKNAFSVTKPCDPLRTYVVIDDVITTGNTLHAAVEALHLGGASRILPLTLAY